MVKQREAEFFVRSGRVVPMHAAACFGISQASEELHNYVVRLSTQTLVS